MIKFQTNLILGLALMITACSTMSSDSDSAGKGEALEPLVIAKIDAENEDQAWKVLSKGRIKKGNWNMGEYTTMFIEAIGDDQEYVFYIKDSKGKANNYRYEKEFQVADNGKESVVKLRFDEFVAYQKGSNLPDAEPLDLDDVVEMGIRVKNLRSQKYTLAVNSFWAEAE